jgi:abortive infection bacteriophage resistance protein
MLLKLREEIDRSREVFIQHYRNKYTSPKLPPLWAVTESMSFGELSKWFKETSDKQLKSKIAKELGAPSLQVFESSVQVLSLVRNTAAHHNRLWNRRFTKSIPKIQRYKCDMHIIGPESGQSADKRIYNVLIVSARFLLHQTPDSSYVERLRALVDELSEFERNAMGFPANWRTRPIWQT